MRILRVIHVHTMDHGSHCITYTSVSYSHRSLLQHRLFTNVHVVGVKGVSRKAISPYFYMMSGVVGVCAVAVV
jgi:hypothetical protein